MLHSSSGCGNNVPTPSFAFAVYFCKSSSRTFFRCNHTRIFIPFPHHSNIYHIRKNLSTGCLPRLNIYNNRIGFPDFFWVCVDIAQTGKIIFQQTIDYQKAEFLLGDRKNCLEWIKRAKATPWVTR